MNYYPINPQLLSDIAQLKLDYKNIISKEVGLELSRDFFCYQKKFYPIKIKFNIQEHDQTKIVIGSFNSQNLTITINYYYYKYLNNEDKLNLLRHEIAHYLDFIQRGDYGQQHDAHFHHLCESMGWGNDVYASTINSEIVEKIKKSHKNKERSQKLMALANNNSSWAEAQSALLKAKAMMQSDYDIKTEAEDEFQYIALELLSGNRFTQKYQTISQLLENFSCKCIVLTTPGNFTLEVITQAKNRHVIQDLFTYFNDQVDQWYSESKKINPKLHRTSFYQGLQKGLEQKIKQQEQQYFAYQTALINTDAANLSKYFKLLYPRTSQNSTKSKRDFWSFFQGQNMAKRIELKHKLNQTLKYLT